MGLFDRFKKKEEPVVAQPVRNNPNSVFTIRFTIPYFQIFDKTDPELSALPVKMGVTGSCQYRISEPDLCFDNVPLAEMSPEQLEAHVKDALTMNIKTYFASITSIPLLQFESMIAKISDATKARITPILNDEFGISLRAFSISGVRYDTEDPNYLRLQTISQKTMEHRAKKVDLSSDIELEHLKLDSSISAKRKEEESAIELERKRKEHEFELRRQREELNMMSEKNELELDALRTAQDLERKRKADEIEMARKKEQEHLNFELEHKRNEMELERLKTEKALEAQQKAGAFGGLDEGDSDGFSLDELDDDFKL